MHSEPPELVLDVFGLRVYKRIGGWLFNDVPGNTSSWKDNAPRDEGGDETIKWRNTRSER